MSYGLDLYKLKDKLLTPKDLEKLGDRFGYKIGQLDKDGNVLGFNIDYKNKFNEDAHDSGFEVYYQDESSKGYYWTYISYGADENAFKDFLNLFIEISILLGMDIFDPQIAGPNFENIKMSPQEYTNIGPLRGKVAFDKMKSIIPQVADTLGLKTLSPRVPKPEEPKN